MCLLKNRLVNSVLLVLLLKAFPLIAQSQSPATAVESLAIEFWPDYDRPSVLVLLTGTLPADASLPATVTLPLPEGAELNAVARISSENVMSDDIEFTTDSGQLTFTTPDGRFRVEYYLPYAADGTQRAFTYTWQASIPVMQLEVTIQEPAAASLLIIEPPAATSSSGFNGLTYHRLPVQSVPAGQPYAVRVDYTLTSSQLSIEQAPAAAIVEGTETTGSAATVNWPLIAAAVGGVLIVMALTWQIASSGRAEARRRKARPVRPRKQSPARFCYECGQSLQPGDSFCRQCGTAIKGT
jgi:hypothetical protein